MADYKNKGFATRTIHNARHEGEYGALTFPIYATSTIVFDDAQQGGRRFALEEDGLIYSRLGNPSTLYLEEKIANLEGCEAALCLSSGMGAIGTVFMTALKTGDHVVSDKVIYGCTHALFEHQLHKFGIEVTFVDFTNIDEVKAAIKDNTKILYVETPANPTLKIVDLKVVADLAKEYNLMSVVDNTVATPYLTRPKEFGIDVIVHSATKYINGHGDVIAGIICGDADFLTKCRLEGQKDITGSVMSPFDAFLINRGLKTLHVRMEKHCENAMKVAEFLEGHPAVKKVYYPGLASHEGHEIAKRQMNGKYSGLIAFELNGGYDAALTLANTVEIFKLAVSLGDCESLIQHPASMTHSPYSPEDRKAAGIDDGLLRASIGLECADDIIADLKDKLDKLV
ncbi:methionine-gamma-lyase [Bacilli bacterium PM5-3]|nr:methionine-gamma-lyase [Bacilli bacterium PM5-3]MDH6603850.1 methionine-gamma-lyase [Bacilli bacterium PM5-9]